MPEVIKDKNPRLKVSISKKYSPRERRAIAQDIIDYLAERTKRGLGKDAKPWSGKAAEYSESYKKSLDFKNGGKGSTVDLTLSDEMLNSFQAKDKSGELVIGLDEAVRGKAQGNILGTYGQSKPIRGKARNFLDLSRAELSAILSNYPLNNKSKREETLAESDASADRAEEIVDSLFLDNSSES